MAVYRIAAKRRLLNTLDSDNKTNFFRTDEELRLALNQMDYKKLSSFVLKNKFLWEYDSQTAYHMGGSWGKMIRSVKDCLACVLYVIHLITKF